MKLLDYKRPDDWQDGEGYRYRDHTLDVIFSRKEAGDVLRQVSPKSGTVNGNQWAGIAAKHAVFLGLNFRVTDDGAAMQGTLTVREFDQPAREIRVLDAATGEAKTIPLYSYIDFADFLPRVSPSRLPGE